MVANELQLPIAVSTLTLDQRASRKDIDRKFGELEQRAKQDKSAIGIASPYPVTLNASPRGHASFAPAASRLPPSRR